ncbi:D-amino acid dehydrogenase [Methylonatrum kenyense]|uniref:D-amino acid dehydrogenase n=1 Tax=Methylonatrum kenyense TaxID=455253 RepID=UPI0020BE4F5F|nr:D-amino acid dehydrogenase [Methylonatrum kenyense]MCK8516211.1 D-amino acid dehydrogenase [Methylonatrum kenyense]
MRILIIGAGLAGVTTAWFLQDRGHQVRLFDRQPTAANETSFANGGLLHASHAEPWNAPGVLGQLLRWIGREDSPLLLRPRALPGLMRWGLGFLRYSRPQHYRLGMQRNAALALHSIAVLRELRRELDLRYDDRQNGILKIFRDQQTLDGAVDNSRTMADVGLRHTVLDSRQAVALEPALADCAHELSGAIYFPEDESGDAHLFCQALIERFRRAGGELELQTSVSRMLRKGDRIEGVQTDAGVQTADCYVLAAGSFSTQLAATAGLRLPIYPVKGYSLTAELPDWGGAPAIPLIDDGNKVVMGMLGSRLRMAGTAEFNGFDLSLSEARSDYVLRQCLKTFPSLADRLELADASPWCGLRPMTMDGPPILGPSPLRGLYLNCGAGHLGWTLACGSGQLVADLISGEPPAMDAEAYSLARF